jgi:RHS repeat-associated protein
LLRCEPLEGRMLLSTVNWTGNGDGSSWDDYHNWSTGSVPGSGDDVVISTAAAATVTIQSGDAESVNSLTTAGNDTLAITGGSLAVAADSTIAGPLAMTGGSLRASGSGVTLQANGPTTMAKASAEALGGATLSLPQLASFSSTVAADALFEASGPGSQLELANLSSLSTTAGAIGFVASAVAPDGAAGGGNGTIFEALDGGVIDLPALASAPGANTVFKADGAGSAIDAATLTTLLDGQLALTNAGTIAAPNLVLVQDVAVTTGPADTFTLLSDQTYVSSGAQQIKTGTLLDQGGISVLNYASMQVTGSLDVGGAGAVSVAAGGTLEISGDLLGNTTNVDDFSPLGNVVFDSSSASVANPQHLEAMSAELGASQAGFSHNFAYGSLTVPDGGYLQLVDQSHNSSGTGAEAVYADQLSLGAGATLDLNGRNLYVRSDQIDPTATVLGGTVTVVSAGGAISNDTPVTACLNVTGQTNTWTFYAFTGQLATIEVNPGYGDVPAAPNPQLGYAQVTLLDPSNNVVATATSSYPGDLALITELPLTTTGTFTIQIQAASPATTGCYVLTATVVTPAVRPLTVDQQYASALATPYSIDEWTFSGTANESVDLHPSSGDNGFVTYTLTAPNGSTVFSRSDDSGLVNLPDDGNYVLTALSSNGTTGGYSFELEQTSVVALSLGDTYSGTLTGSGYAQLFTVNVPTNEVLRVNLGDNTPTNVNELYARLGAPPTRGDYDFSSTTANSANQQFLVPSADPGTWYILVYGNSVPAASSYTLAASTTPILLSTVTPNQSATGNTATLVLSGAGFDNTTTVQLLGAGNSMYAAASASLDTFSQLSATFDLTGVPQKRYAVQVTRGDGSTAELPAAFTVTAPGEANLQTQLILPSWVGRHEASTFYVEYSNTGNVAMPAPVLLLEASNPTLDKPLFTLNPALQSSGFWTSAIPQGYSNTVQILASGAVPGVLEPGESITVPVYYAGMQEPWDWSTSFGFDLREFTTSDSTSIDWASMQSSLQPPGISAAAWGLIYGNMTAQIGGTWGGYVQMLDNQAAYLGSLGESVTDISQLWQFAALQANNALLPTPQLDTATDIALPTPGKVSLDFSRQYLAPIGSRQTLGPLGYGWTDDWQYSLAVATDGTVTVNMPGGGQRIFQPDSRGTDYFAQPGDYGTLLATGGGGFTLTETDGQIESFNADGTLGCIQDTNGNRIAAGYAGGQLTSLTSYSASSPDVPLGSLTIAYNSAGLITSVTSSDGRTVSYGYDAGDQLTQVQSYDGETTQYGYDTSGNPSVAHALTSVQNPDGTQQLFSYDAEGRLAGTSQAGGVNPLTYTYNAGEVTVTDFAGDATQTFYNEQGLAVKAIDPLGNVSFATYDGNLNLTSVAGPTGLVETYAYDLNGNRTGVTNPLGQTDTFSYTGPDNLLASSTDAQGNTTTYQYNASGDLISTQYADGTFSSSTYDALGDPLAIVNQNGQVTSNTYNAAGQVTGETLSDGTTYSFTYDAYGNMITAADAAGTIFLSYDSGNHLTGVAYPNGQTLTYTYASGQRTQMVEQAGSTTISTVNYSYTPTGQLAELTDGNHAPIVTYVYNSLDQLAVAVDGNGAGSGLGPYTCPYTDYLYDADGNLLHVINYAGGTTVNSRFDYTYNPLGQVATMATLGGTWTYSYDATGQLVHAVFAPNQGSAIPSQDLTYVYNAAGDRTQTIVNGTTTTYASNNVNEITSTSDGVTYRYDADGNLSSQTDASGATTTYTYDSLNRLTSITSPTDSWIYGYDALGNLAVTIHNGLVNGQITSQTTTQNLVDPNGGSNVVGQFDSSGDLLANYTYGLGLVSQTTPAGTNYYQFDALGSTADLVNSSGAIQNSYSYLPFGGLLNSTGSAANPFTFVGQLGVSSDGNGLFDMRARSYDPTTGQFVSNDPVGFFAGKMNLRCYAANSPLNLVDPSGRDAVSGNAYGPPPPGTQSPSDAQAAQIANAFGIASGDINAGQNFNSMAMMQGATGGGYPLSAQQIAVCASLTPQQIQAMQEAADAGNQDAMADDYIYETYWASVHSSNPNAPDPSGGTGGDEVDEIYDDSGDPNGLIGPAGYGPRAYVAPTAVLPYEIDFENSPTATAPAQEVTISNPLNANLDPSTFQLMQIAFGDNVLTVPAQDRQFYATTVSMTYNDTRFNVEITAGIDLTMDTVFATFLSVNPQTGLPPSNVLTGFLPPEDGTGRGMGRIDYTIQPKPGLPTGTQITNVAQINFDQNGIIATDQVNDEDPSQGIDPAKQALVTIDSGAPTSSVFALPPQESSTSFTVSWSGQDDPGGSGIASYSIYVAEDGGSFQPWLTGVTSTSATYTGQFGHTYGFYSIATDNVGNQEVKNAVADTQTSLQESTPVITLSNPADITYGTASTLISGTISLVPNAETVSIMLNDVTQTATVESGDFSASFDTHALGVTLSPYTITCSYASDGDFNSVTDTSTTLTVNAAPLTITAGTQSKTYGAALTLGTTAFTTSGLLNGDSVTAVTLISSGAAATAAVAGSPYTITPSAAQGSGLGNYSIIYDTGNLTVSQATPTVNVSDADGTYTGAPFTATATVAGVISGVDSTPAASLEGITPTLTYYAGSTANGSGSTTPPSSVGTYTVVAYFPGGTDYTPAQSTSVTFAINAVPTATPGLYDPASSLWYLRNSNTTGVADILAGYGPPGGNWIPLSGDWTGDGVDTLGLYNPATGLFYLHNSNTTGVADITLLYGAVGQGWIPVVGDWTGQTSSAGFPIDTVGLYDPKTSTWYLRNELTTGVADITIGYGPPGAGWLPLVGDWDGNGTTTVGLYNPATGYFYLRNSNTTGVGNIAFFYGDPTQNWTPVAGDWTGDGHNSIGMYDPKTCTWYLRNELSTGVADMTFSFGSPGSGWLPVMGDWSGVTSAPAIATNSLLSSAPALAPLAQAAPQSIVAAAIVPSAAGGTSSTLPAATTYANYVASNLPGVEPGQIGGNTANVEQNTAGQNSSIDPMPTADEEFTGLGSGARLQAVDPLAVDQIAGSGDLDLSATSLLSGSLPVGMQRLPGANEVDAILAEPGTM